MGQDECRKCLALLEALVDITRDLTFMCREVTGTDELYYAAVDALEMRVEDLKECMSKEAHDELVKNYQKLTEIPWEAEKAEDIVHQIGLLETKSASKKHTRPT